MAFITLDIKKLEDNFEYLDKQFKAKSIDWSVVSKVLSGNKEYLTELLKFGLSPQKLHGGAVHHAVKFGPVDLVQTGLGSDLAAGHDLGGDAVGVVGIGLGGSPGLENGLSGGG